MHDRCNAGEPMRSQDDFNESPMRVHQRKREATLAGSTFGLNVHNDVQPRSNAAHTFAREGDIYSSLTANEFEGITILRQDE